jgi:hypothetical protein
MYVRCVELAPSGRVLALTVLLANESGQLDARVALDLGEGVAEMAVYGVR